MIVGIDASSIRAGGGITHLKELLEYTQPSKFGIDKIVIWSGKKTLDQLPEYSWLQKVEISLLNKSLPFRMYWQLFKLDSLLKKSCDILLSPSGTYTGNFKPFISMSQNMLIFETIESDRFGRLSWMKQRFRILELAQKKSFKKASGVIFISNYAREYICKKLSLELKPQTTIYHGISSRFRTDPKEQIAISKYSFDKPFRILYVSIVNVYKHQWNVVEAVQKLRKIGLPIHLDLVGPYYGPALVKLNQSLSKDNKSNEYIQYHGKADFNTIEKFYHSADAFVFASSCENMPNILIEAMSASLPIASSNFGPMPEVLKDGGLYFNPLDSNDIADVLEKLVSNEKLRTELVSRAYQYANSFSWEKCADETFSYIKRIKNYS